MTLNELRGARLKAHNQGVLACLKRTQVKPPAKGRRNNLTSFYYRGWMSAKTAVGGA